MDTDVATACSELASQLRYELQHGDGEVAYRGGVRYSPKLVRSAQHVIGLGELVRESSPVSDAQGCVLVTGGLGGLGIVTAEALVEAGARCVVLCSRSGKIKRSDQGLQERLDALQSTSGAQVVLEQCDMGDEADVVALLERVRNGFGPLRVLVHAAGVLSDAMLPKQDIESIRRVWGPKAGIVGCVPSWLVHILCFTQC